MIDEQFFKNWIWNRATNDGDNYRKRDPDKAIDVAFSEFVAVMAEHAGELFAIERDRLIADLRDRWKNPDD